MKSIIAIGLLILVPWAHAADHQMDRLKAELVRISEAARGKVGIGIRHLESGDELFIHGDEAFPMASTYKIPMAVQMMSRVDAGDQALDDLHTISASDLHPTHSAMTEHLLPGSKLTLKNLISMMLQYSDNVATDLVLEKAGGPQAVTQKMNELGLAIRVDRPTWRLILDYLDESWMGKNKISPDAYAERLAKAEAKDMTQLDIAFDDDPKDTATPRSMVRLLTMLWQGEVLEKDSAALIIDIMWGTKTGTGRIKGMLPPGTRVSHKTGTIGRTTNDAGIIELPDGAGHVAVVVYIKESKIPDYADREPIIAQVSRAAYDYFLFR